jgi:hypothetical protein
MGMQKWHRNNRTGVMRKAGDFQQLTEITEISKITEITKITSYDPTSELFSGPGFCSEKTSPSKKKRRVINDEMITFRYKLPKIHIL